VRSQLPATYDIPFFVFLLQHTSEVEPLENYETSVYRKVVFEVSNKHSIAESEYGESREFVIFPLSVDILPVRDIDESGSV